MSADPARTAPPADQAPQVLGPFLVRAEAADAEAFRRETRGTDSIGVPFTFPVRWLTRSEIRAAASKMIGEPAWIPLHESQSFAYRHALKSDVDYHMKVEISREATPLRIILRAEIATGENELCLSMEMILRILTMALADDGNGGAG